MGGGSAWLIRLGLVLTVLASAAEGWSTMGFAVGLSGRSYFGEIWGRPALRGSRLKTATCMTRSAGEGKPVAKEDTGDEFSALSLAMEPSPDISPEDVMLCLMRGLKYNDIPRKNSGLERCFNFADSMCRAAIGGDGGKTGSHQVSLDNFIKYAQNPTFSTMTNCKGFSREPLNIIPGTETRGALATQVVRVTTANGQVRPFLWTLQQERRPPNIGCWQVRQCLYMDNAIVETM